METALAKFEVAKMSAGKKTPIMTLPLDFPALSNEQVTIFDVTTNYPASPRVMQEYLSDLLRIPATHIVVRKPGEPTEEYQDDMQVARSQNMQTNLRHRIQRCTKGQSRRFHSVTKQHGLVERINERQRRNKDATKRKRKCNEQRRKRNTKSVLKNHKSTPNRRKEIVMEMIDVLTKLKEIAESRPELVKDAVENVEKTNPKAVTEGGMKDYLHDEAEKMSRKEFIEKHGESLAGFWDSINGTEEAVEGKIPAGLKAYQDKKAGKEEKEDKKETVKEAIQISTDHPQEASMMMQILKLSRCTTSRSSDDQSRARSRRKSTTW